MNNFHLDNPTNQTASVYLDASVSVNLYAYISIISFIHPCSTVYLEISIHWVQCSEKCFRLKIKNILITNCSSLKTALENAVSSK